MKVEHVPGVGLTTGRTAQQKGELTVGPGVLGEVIVDDQCIPPLLHELLSDGAAGVGGDVLQRGGVGGMSGNHDGVPHRPIVLQDGHRLRDLR